MPVHAVIRDIEFSTHKPFGKGRIPFQNSFPRLNPVQFLGGFCPKSLEILIRFGINR